MTARAHCPEATSDPRESLATVIATSSRDWSLDRGDAWIYGIVLGWGDAMSEVAKRHGWTGLDVLRLHRLHLAFRDLDAP